MPFNTKSAALKSYYSARAAEYDDIYTLPERQEDLQFLQDWVSAIFTNKHVIEIACGTGYWSRFFANKAASTLAIDASEEAISIAKKRKGNERVRFRVGNAYALPKHLGKLDAAFAGFWLSHVPLSHLRNFMVEMHSRLPPYSLVAFIDNRYVEGSSTPIASQDEHKNTYQVRQLRDGTQHKVLKNFLSREQLEKATEGLGCRFQYRELDYYWTFSFETK